MMLDQKLYLRSNERLATIVCAGVRRNIVDQHVLCLALVVDDGKIIGDRFNLHPPDAELDRLNVLGRAAGLDRLTDTLPPDTLQLIGKRVVVMFDEKTDEYRPPLAYRLPCPSERKPIAARIVPCRACITAWLAKGPVGP